nr:unnamed protein product [Spirometra erinaceieuropaei]
MALLMLLVSPFPQEQVKEYMHNEVVCGDNLSLPSPRKIRDLIDLNFIRSLRRQRLLFVMSNSDRPPYITLETSQGDIVIELYWNHAPQTCKNFAELAKRGYYTDVPFHRVIRDFMIQGGDPTGTGRGGASIYGRYFEDEIHPDLKHSGAGIVSMANAGPNTNGSQFFITLAPTQWLDGKHTIFGRVNSGMQVVKRLGMVETDAADRPVEPLKIKRAYVPTSI